MTRPATLRYPTVWAPVPLAALRWLARRRGVELGTDQLVGIRCGFETLSLELRDGRSVELVADRRSLRRLVGLLAPIIRVRALVTMGPIVLVPIESHARGAFYAVDAFLGSRAVAAQS